MPLSNLNPLNYFGPPTPDRATKYAESIQPLAPPVHRQIFETGKQIARTLAGTAVTVATLPAAAAEAGLYATANVLALPSVVFNKVASTANHVRTKTYNIVMGPHVRTGASSLT